jgi:drug/metabolite transporter (DMT)-like permease
MVKVVALWGITSILSAIVAGIIAGLKRRDHSFWAAWSFLFPPMLLLLVCLRPNRGPRPKRPSADELETDERRFL